MNEKPTHGGRRPGAGRKPIGNEPTEPRSITLTPGDWQHVEAVGLGNASAGVRAVIERDRRRRKRDPGGAPNPLTTGNSRATLKTWKRSTNQANSGPSGNSAA